MSVEVQQRGAADVSQQRHGADHAHDVGFGHGLEDRVPGGLPGHPEADHAERQPLEQGRVGTPCQGHAQDQNEMT